MGLPAAYILQRDDEHSAYSPVASHTVSINGQAEWRAYAPLWYLVKLLLDESPPG